MKNNRLCARTGPRAAATICGVAIIYLILALLCGGRVTAHPGTYVFGDTTSDAAGVVRGLWVDDVEHKTPFTATRDWYEGAPEGVPLATAVNFIQPLQPGAVWAFAQLIGRVAAVNLFLLLGIVSTATSMFAVLYLLLRLAVIPALVAGFAAGFNPWVVEQALAGHLAFTFLAPIILLAAASARLAVRRTAASAAYVGLAFGASFLTAAYMGLVASAVLASGFILILIRTHSWGDRLWVASLACIALALPLAMLLPGAIDYTLRRNTTARLVSHTASGSGALGIWPHQYLNPAPYLRVLGPLHVGDRGLAFGSAESVAFFGFSTLALAVAGLLILLRGLLPERARYTRAFFEICGITGAIAVLLSMPPHLVLGRVKLPLPSDILAHLTTYYRIYARFAIVVGLVFIAFAAVALDVIWHRTRWLAVGVAAVVILELYPSVLPAWSTSAQPLDVWLRSHPIGIVVDYPQPTDNEVAGRLGLSRLAFQPQYRDPSYTLLSSGTSGTREAAIRILTRYLTDPATPGLLAAEHVRYVVVHADAYAAERQQTPEPPATEFSPLGRVGNAKIYRLRSGIPPANVDQVLAENAVEVALVEGLRPPPISYSGFGRVSTDGWRPFTGTAQIHISVTDPAIARLQIIVQLRTSSGNATVQLVGPNGESDGQALVGMNNTQVSFGPFSIGGGRSTYELQTNPPSSTVEIGPLLAQPLANYSVSIASP